MTVLPVFGQRNGKFSCTSRQPNRLVDFHLIGWFQWSAHMVSPCQWQRESLATIVRVISAITFPCRTRRWGVPISPWQIKQPGRFRIRDREEPTQPRRQSVMHTRERDFARLVKWTDDRGGRMGWRCWLPFVKAELPSQEKQDIRWTFLGLCCTHSRAVTA
jgi:hypothetical protein